jgi:Mannosylglycerate hydrolase MGH1-like glycoside hydrolase domain
MLMRVLADFAGRRRLKRFLGASAAGRRALVEAESRRALESNWVAQPGFTMPNRRKYPWQWLWDSCFHAIAWSALGDPRCRTELESLFSLQLPNGFLPHMGYHTEPARSLSLWHSRGRSDITQPPMYGHALRVLAGRGFGVEHLYDQATAALRYLFERRRDPASGMIRVLHPWESGCDDSPRWDGWESRPFSERRWKERKRYLVRSIALQDGAASSNPQFEVASSGFSALVAFNARELAALTGDAGLRGSADALCTAIEARWLEDQRTWSDVRVRGPGDGASAPTLDGLLAVLVSDEERHVEAAFAEMFDSASFWRPYGPAGAAANAPGYEPNRYWRGDAWPQEVYLMMVAALRRGLDEAARRLAEKLVLGCTRSCFAERWNPETGAALGAAPQGWAALASEGVRVLRGDRRP